MHIKYSTYVSPLGTLYLYGWGRHVVRLDFEQVPVDAPYFAKYFTSIDVSEGTSPVIETLKGELEAYFYKKSKSFSVPFRLFGTEFRQNVWRLLCDVPYGQTATYGALAARLGKPRACRAVGGAIHNNPLALVVPCHRVIGADGSLTGFGGGLDRKAYLLQLEGIHYTK